MTRPTEREVRNYALHLLSWAGRPKKVRTSVGAAPWCAVRTKAQLGAFRSWRAVNRALEQWSEEELARLEEK